MAAEQFFRLLDKHVVATGAASKRLVAKALIDLLFIVCAKPLSPISDLAAGYPF
jgi:hypothetical protein